ncbi:hypothetical protein [Ensifer sp. ENS11]|uniref:hypothetical protein n=1 Tax=Ensifer sp. ENS11 TaxID=2769291 RepID=UPI00130D6B8F|nr:hypothetical protein [Ensifer sp. ENS11]MBD9492245.1 hypothetical protein [Ensifer sp. ENS11]MDP9634919.1 hypothetical protein [Ensifer adhaerens]
MVLPALAVTVLATTLAELLVNDVGVQPVPGALRLQQLHAPFVDAAEELNVSPASVRGRLIRFDGNGSFKITRRMGTA